MSLEERSWLRVRRLDNFLQNDTAPVSVQIGINAPSAVGAPRLQHEPTKPGCKDAEGVKRRAAASFGIGKSKAGHSACSR
jgi:hypothetical protein